MQNKGFVKFIAIMLTLVCIFYLSFTFVTMKYENKAKAAVASGECKTENEYLDAHANDTVYNIWLVKKSLRETRALALGLGLDLKGGMNVVVEVSGGDVIKSLSDHKETTDPIFAAAVDEAKAKVNRGDGEFVENFVEAYKSKEGHGPLAALFATTQMGGKVTPQSTDDQVQKALEAEVKAAIDNSFNVLRSRIDRFGVAQPNIQRLESGQGRIMVELPGVNEFDKERVYKMLTGSANLEFWETYNLSEIQGSLIELNTALARAAVTEEEPVAAEEVTEEQAEKTEAAEGEETTEGQDIDLKEMIAQNAPVEGEEGAAPVSAAKGQLLSMLQMGNPGSCIAGYALRKDTAAINEMLASEDAKAILPQDLKLLWSEKGEERNPNLYALYAIHVTTMNGRPRMEGDAVEDASAGYDQFGNPVVNMEMNSDGARAWATLTEENLGRCVAIVLDEHVYSAPVVRTKIEGGRSEISGNFTVQETSDLANVLKSGRMPAPATVISADFIGPSLGQEAINQGIWSFVIAFIILMVYMMVMYGAIPGMVANGALLLNLFFTIGILCSFQAALTMSGIAGLVLSLGMAVDANVLIYERAKEELRAGKRTREALSAGYSNAFSAIFDSNLTSIITGVILFQFGTGPVRGFATTLIIGILVSFFTAVFLTRVVYEGRMAKDKWLNLSFQTPLGKKVSFENKAINFMAKSKMSFCIFILLAVISVVGMIAPGFNKGIDFTGGRNYVIEFENKVNLEDARKVLDNAFPSGKTTAILNGTDGLELRVTTNYLVEQNGNDIDAGIETVLTCNHDTIVALGNDSVASVAGKIGTVKQLKSSQKVGPSMAKDITNGAIKSVLFAFIAIFLYILLRFRNLAFSVGAITALFFDIILILGAYALLWSIMPFSMEIDQVFIGAILTAIGYSINDKVVVFDRIREFIGLYPKRDRRDLFNSSLNSTLNRTVNTSVSTLIVLLCIFILGGASIRSFAFAMILGVVIGTITSMFIAAPTAYLIIRKRSKKAAKAAEEK